MTAIPEFQENALLAALPADAARYWSPSLEWVPMVRDQVLHESGSSPTHAYFPTTSVVSLDSVFEDGASPGLALVGNEGVVGMSLFTGAPAATDRAVVLSAGHGFRLPAYAVEAGLGRSPGTLRLLMKYAQTLMTQIGRTGACNRHHSLLQQVCRWLLITFDRLPSEELLVTQELIAQTLGVRREGVCDVALKLQEAGLIRYARGHILIVDRPGLEQRACECYSAVCKQYEWLLPGKDLHRYAA